MNAMNIIGVIKDQFALLIPVIKNVFAALMGIQGPMLAVNSALSSSLPILAAISIAVTAGIAIFNAFSESAETQAEKINTLNQELNELQSEYNQLSGLSSPTQAEEARLKVLEAQISAKERLLKLEAEEGYEEEFGEKSRTEWQIGYSDVGYGPVLPTFQAVEHQYSGIEVANEDLATLQRYNQRLKEIDQQILSLDENSATYSEDIEALTQQKEELQEEEAELTETLSESVSSLQNYIDNGHEATDADTALINGFLAVVEAQEEYYGTTQNSTDSLTQNTDITSNLTKTIEELSGWTETASERFNALSDASDVLTSAVEEYNENGYFSASMLEKLLSLDDEYLSMLSMENGQLVLNSQALYDKSVQLKQTAIQEAVAEAAARLYALAMGGATEETEKASTVMSSVASDDGALGQFYKATLDVAKGAMTAGEAILYMWTATEPESRAYQVFSDETKAQMKGILENLQNTVDIINSFEISGPEDLSGATSEATSASEKQTDILKEQQDIFDERINILEHELFLLEKRNGTEEERIAKLKEIQKELHAQAEWYRSQGLDDNSEYIRELQEQWWNYQDEIDSINEEIAEAAEKAWEDAIDAQKDYLDSQKEAYEAAFDYIVSQIDKEIDLLEEQKSAEEEYWDAKIDALNEQNEALQDQIDLEEALDALARAKQNKVLVYKDGKFQYVQDTTAVSEARKNLEDLQREQELEEETQRLEQLKNQAVSSIEDQIEYWEKYRDEWSSVVDGYTDEQNKLLAEQVLGIKLEGDNWKTRLDNLTQYVNEYNKIMSNLASLEAVSEAGYSGGSSGTDWSALWWEAENNPNLSESERETLQNYYHEQKAEELKGTGATYNPATGAWTYATGTLSAHGGMSLVGEEGPELRILNKGEGIIPSDITKNLMDIGKYSVQDLVNNVKKSYTYMFDKIVLPGVTDFNSFLEEMKRFNQYALQR